MLANFCGCGLVSWENRPMKSLNHDTRHFWCHDSDDKKMADDKYAYASMLFAIVTAKQNIKADITGYTFCSVVLYHCINFVYGYAVGY